MWWTLSCGVLEFWIQISFQLRSAHNFTEKSFTHLIEPLTSSFGTPKGIKIDYHVLGYTHSAAKRDTEVCENMVERSHARSLICQNLVHKQTTLLAGWVRAVKKLTFSASPPLRLSSALLERVSVRHTSSPSPTSLKKSLPQAYIMSESLSLSADFSPGS